MHGPRRQPLLWQRRRTEPAFLGARPQQARARAGLPPRGEERGWRGLQLMVVPPCQVAREIRRGWISQ
eukprot:scaffold115_cov304-Prasinococcus_capsulatus_cf.AAC.41